jgi:hypothetical protein
MSVDMAEHMDFDHAGLQQVANAVQNNAAAHEDIAIAGKRKRGPSDSADGPRRGVYKRERQDGHDETDDAAIEAAESDAAVGALQDYSNENGAPDHASASSTAAAALAGIYPTMTIPQPTDVAFASQASDEQRGDSSFNMGDESQANESFMDNSASGGHSSGGRGSATGSKPAVGSEEWHKVRKDNHKEGS